MNRRVSKSLLLIFYVSTFSAQINVPFIEHLSNTNLKVEHLSYLNSLTQNNDSTRYFKAKYYLKYFNDSLFFKNYETSTNLCDADSSLIKQASITFLNGKETTYTQKWFHRNNESNLGDIYTNLEMINKAAINPNLFTKEDFPEELQKSYGSYKKIYHKKPIVAAFLSTLVPGLGKLYAGKARSFGTTFLLNAAYAAQSIESSYKLGIQHPLSIINIGAFSVFYLSNIYGSYKAILDLKKERKKQFIIDATNSYN